jgi:hypothetical protein
MTAAIQTPVPSANSPLYTPIGTDTVVRTLDDAAIRAGVMFYGDSGTGRSSRALQLLEQRLAVGEQCIAFVYSKRAFRLNRKPDGKSQSGHVLHTFGGKRGKEAHGFAIVPEDGAAFGTIAADGGRSFVFDVSCFDYEQVTTFLQAFLGTFMTTATRPATILIDDFNVSIARRRGGGDSQALKNFHALVVRGRDDDIKFIGVSTSPGEVPLEGRNEVTTSILTGTKTPQHLVQLVPVIGVNIKTFAKFGGLGIAKQPAGHHWLKMPTDRNDDLYYLKRVEFQTGAGDRSPLSEDFETPGVKDVMSQVKAARSKGKGDKKGEKGKADKGLVGATKPTRIGIAQVYDLLGAQNVTNVISHASIARTLVAIDAGMNIDQHFRMDPSLVLTRSLQDPLIATATAWTVRNARMVSKILSPTLAGAALATFGREDVVEAKAFMDSLVGRTERSPVVQDALDRLLRMPVSKAPLMGTARMKLLGSAWSEHLAARLPSGEVVDMVPSIRLRQAA